MRFRWLVGLALAGACAALLPGAAPTPAEGGAMAGRLVAAGLAGATAPPPGSQLVSADEELARYLKQAEDYIQDKAYNRAIDILQTLVLRANSGFVPVDKGRRFIALRLVAADLIGKMPPEGLRRYRALYDPQAERLYAEGVARGDTASLRRLIARYQHSSYGVDALNALGELYLDRGAFLQASTVWQRAVSLERDAQRKAAFLAKLVLASHLADDPETTRKYTRELQRHHGGATADLGGRQWKLADFVKHALKLEVPSPVRRDHAGARWPGLGAVGNGIGLMSDCEVVLMPRWRQPEGDPVGRDLAGSLIAHRDELENPNAQLRWFARLRNGHVYARRTNRSAPGGSAELVLPSAVHPVVIGDEVVVRTHENVVAYDGITGEMVWQTFGLPLVKQSPTPVGYRHTGIMPAFRDNGRQGLTVGDGEIYALAGFRPATGMLYHRPFGPGNPAKQQADTSSLAAVSIVAQGRLLWRVPGPQTDSEVLQACKFLCAPAYKAGRLYAMVLHLENYYVACLDARAKGRTIWERSISQTPVVRRGSYSYPHLLDLGSTPAVVDGRVYVCTNAGVVASLDAETGQPNWAYQYPSIINTGTPTRSVPSTAWQGKVYKPANPVVVAQGRVVVLPADCDFVFALDADTGDLKWQQDRGHQHDLSGIDEQRVLLSGEGLVVRRITDGREVYLARQAKGVWGRPAVTPTCVLASGSGVIYRLNLKNYQLGTTDRVAADGLLGNLVGVSGRLVAANASGVCAYFSYDTAREKITQRLDRASPADKAELLFQRAHLAFGARRFDDALADYVACEATAKANGDSAMLSQLPPRFYRTYVGLGNQAASNEKMYETFEKAQRYAQSNQDKAHILLRLAKCHVRIGETLKDQARIDEVAKAVDLAQQIRETYASEDLVDVQIGPDAADAIRFDPSEQTIPAKVLARDFINELRQRFGPDVYAVFDAKAKIALDAAVAEGDPLKIHDVAKRWPNSKWADAATFSAAEVYYLKALEAEARAAEEMFGHAIGLLSDVANRSGSSLQISANVGLAAIYARSGQLIAARLRCDLVRDLPEDAAVEFANVRGKLGEIIASIDSGKVPQAARAMKPRSSLTLPLRESYAVEGDNAQILRDHLYRPIRIGEGVFLLHGSRVVMIDAGAAKAGEAVAWSGLGAFSDNTAQGNAAIRPPATRLVAGLSADRKVLAVADSSVIVGFDIRTCKRLWELKIGDMGVSGSATLAAGAGVVLAIDSNGRVGCADVATGRNVWRSSLVGGNRHPYGVPDIAAGHAIVRHNGARSMTCFDLKTGKVVKRWTAQRAAQGYVLPGGLIAVMVDGTVELIDPSKMDKPLWTKAYPAQDGAAILAASPKHIVVSPHQTSQLVEVLDAMRGGAEASRFSTVLADGRAAIPVDAAVDDGGVYVVCSLNPVGVKKSYYELSRTVGLVVQKYDMARRRVVWHRMLLKEGAHYPLPITLGREHLVVMSLPQQTTMPVEAWVLASADGGQVEKLDLIGKETNQAVLRQRARLGPPVMTNGRLCVEALRGVVVYTGR